MKKIKKKFKHIIKNDFFKNLIIYTILFIILMSFILYIFLSYKKWFIINSSNNDGLHQNIVTLSYFRELLVNFIRTGHLSTFTWNIGSGIDLFSNFAYTITGDLFSFLSILVRTKDVDLLYNILIILRIYCIGISFLCYAKYHKMNTTGSIIGALIYTFSAYVLTSSIKHPQFSNPIILFPLLMIGIEKIIKEDKFIYYTCIIAISYLVSFYFAYQLSLIIAIYGIIVAINTYKSDGVKKIIKILLKTLFYSLIGIMISAFLLLPTSIQFIESERTATGSILPYTLSYYRNILNAFLTEKGASYWAVVGTQSIIYIFVPMFIINKKKDDIPLIFLLLILFSPLLIAQVGSIFMGFNYPNNRWSFVFSFIFAFMTTSVISYDKKMSKKELLIILFGIVILFFVNNCFDITISQYTMTQIMFLILWIIIMNLKDAISKIFKKINVYNIILIFLILLGIGTSIKYLYDVDGKNYVSSFSDYDEFDYLINTSNKTIPDFNNALNFIKNNDNGFYKISKSPYFYENVSLLHHFNALGYYYSIIPNIYSKLNLDLQNSQYYILHGVGEFDYRTKILTLLGGKYLIKFNENKVPYGFSKLKYKGDSKIYINDWNLPFGELYTKYINENEYNKLSPLEKENCLMKATVVENTENLNHIEEKFIKNIKEVDYKILDENNIIKDKNKIVVENTKKNTFKLKIDDIKNSEVYVSFENLKHEPFNRNELIDFQLNQESVLEKKSIGESILLDKASAEKKYKWYQIDTVTGYYLKVKYKKTSKSRNIRDFNSTYYMDIYDFMFNLGYYDETSGEITVTLSELGNYTFDDIKVYAVSMDDYEEDINNLRRSNFETTDWGYGYLNGTVDAEENGILQFQTMYSKGWKVYVDDKEVPTIKSNKYFLGIEIGKGKHNISLKYHTPYLKEGAIVSLIGIIIFIITIVVNKKRKYS